MKKNAHRFVALLLVMCLLAVGIPPAAAVQTVTVELDNKVIFFPEAKPYFNEAESRVYVPVRILCEALEATVDYEGATKTVTITRGGTTLKLRIGVKTATVNGVAVALDAAPYMENGSTYVPLRFVAENLLLTVEWDAANFKVILTSSLPLKLGMNAQKARSNCGEPARTAVSEKGYTWWVYDDLANYKMIGVQDDKVVAYYLHSGPWQVESGLRVGMTAADCDALLSASKSEQHATYTVYNDGETIHTLFFDEKGELYALMEELVEYVDLMRISVAVLDGFVRQLMDLVNVERHKLGLPILVSDESISDVARSHANDMAKNNLFGHTGSDNTSPSDRLTAAGFEDFYEVEVIARAFPNALTAFSAHLSDEQFRTVLKTSYTTIGAGVAYNPQSDGILYYTQVFYVSK